MLVKICGLSNFIDAKSAVESGADALGFVMGGKILPVEVEPAAQLVRKWIADLPKNVDTFIVSHFTNVQDLLDLANYVRSSGIQVSESLTAAQLKELRNATNKKIIKTVPADGPGAVNYLKEVEPYCDFLLLDSVVNGYIGGTGHPNDWDLCAQLVRAAKKPVFVAGGLNPENLLNVMKITAPQGVDVSTGVSTFSDTYLRKDRKDPKAIRIFIERAKAAVK